MTTQEIAAKEFQVALLEQLALFSEKITERETELNKQWTAKMKELESSFHSLADELHTHIDKTLERRKEELQLDKEEIQNELHSYIDTAITEQLQVMEKSVIEDTVPVSPKDELSITPEFNLYTELLKSVQKYDLSSIFINGSISLAEMDRAVHETTRAFKQSGFESGDAVILICDSDPVRNALVILTTLNAGGTIIPFYADDQDSWHIQLLNDPRINGIGKWFLTCPDNAVTDIINDFQSTGNTVSTVSLSCQIQQMILYVKPGHVKKPNDAALIVLDEHGDAVELTLEQLNHPIARALESAVYQNISQQERHVVATALHLDSAEGVVFGLLTPLSCGYHVHFADSQLEDDGFITYLFEALQPETTVSLFCSSTAAVSIWQFIESRRPLSSTAPVHCVLQQLVLVGRSVPAVVRMVQTFTSWIPSLEIYRAYSHSAAGGICATTDDLAHPLEISMLKSIGAPGSLCYLQGIRSNEKLTDPGKAGELYINVMDRSIATGDMACYDPAGNLHLLGQKTNLLQTSKGPVLSLKYEELLASFPLIQDAAIAQYKDRRVAFVVLATSGENYREYAVESIGKFMEKQCPPEIKLDQIQLVGKIPRTSYGCIKWDELNNIN